MRDEQIGINSNDILLNQQTIGELKMRIFNLEGDNQVVFGWNKELGKRVVELEEAIKHHGDRLHALEEKERLRAMKARDEHARDVS